jgi:DNA-binding NarL/FixJ family response regulator
VGAGDSLAAAIVDVDESDASYDVVWQLAELERPCRCVLVGSSIGRATMREAFLVGVAACLSKPLDPHTLHLAVRNAVEGTRLARACLSSGQGALERPRGKARVTNLESLTPREREVFELVLLGSSTRAMAEKLGVSQRTVKFHVANILGKLGVRSRLSLLASLRAQGDLATP